jgi:hypothetical protein
MITGEHSVTLKSSHNSGDTSKHTCVSGYHAPSSATRPDGLQSLRVVPRNLLQIYSFKIALRGIRWSVFTRSINLIRLVNCAEW